MKKQMNANRCKQLIRTVAGTVLIMLFAAAFVAAQDADAIFNQGLKLFGNGKYEEAIAAFQKYAALKPDELAAPLNIGEAYYRLNQFDKAVEYYRKAVAIDADYKDAWESMGDVLFSNQKKWAEAADAYEHLAKLAPTADNYYTLGSAYYNNDQYDKAAAAYRQSLALNPKDKDTKQSLADAEAKAKSNNANGSKQSNATTDDAQFAQGETLFKQGLEYDKAGDKKKAIKAWEQAAKILPDQAAIFFNLGTAYYNTRQYTKSVAAFQEVSRLDPNHADLKEYLAQAEAAKKAEKDKQNALWAGVANAVAEVAASDDEDKSQDSEKNSSSETQNSSGDQTGGQRLKGRYVNNEQGVISFTFSTNGTFQRGGAASGTVRGGEYSSGYENAGTYNISGGVLTLNHKDGRSEELKIVINIGTDEEDSAETPYRLVIDGTSYIRSRF